jgi:DNA-binding transcriptional MerR regulator
MSKRNAVPALLPHFLTIRQLAKALHCCPQTVRNWCKRGLLPPPLRTGGRKRLWNAEEVRNALARLQEPAAEGEA